MPQMLLPMAQPATEETATTLGGKTTNNIQQLQRHGATLKELLQKPPSSTTANPSLFLSRHHHHQLNQMNFNNNNNNNNNNSNNNIINNNNNKAYNNLSPTGQFKYIKRQAAKMYYSTTTPTGGGAHFQHRATSTRLASAGSAAKDRVRRPLNCFMVFSHLERRRVAEEHPELHNADLSKILGINLFKFLTLTEKSTLLFVCGLIRVDLDRRTIAEWL